MTEKCRGRDIKTSSAKDHSCSFASKHGHSLGLVPGKSRRPTGDAWYMQTFCYLPAPLACVMLCVGVYWGREMM